MGAKKEKVSPIAIVVTFIVIVVLVLAGIALWTRPKEDDDDESDDGVLDSAQQMAENLWGWWSGGVITVADGVANAWVDWWGAEE